MKGVSLEQATVVVLELDGTLVYVETMETTYAGVVALPDQPTERTDERVFTPGRVGMKKISPFSSAAKVIPMADLSERNKTFIATFEKLRAEHGNNYVDRTPEEAAAEAAKLAGPVKKAKRTPEEKAAAKAAKKAKTGPRFLQRCVTCGEQPGHPSHGDADGQHPCDLPAAPAPLCAACDEPESDPVHAKEKADGGHKFIAGKKFPRADKPAREPKEKPVRAAKPPKTKPAALDLDRKFTWAGDDKSRAMLAAMNPKYKDGNSGAAIIDLIKATGGVSVHDVAGQLAGHAKWAGISLERLTVAFTQLAGAGLIS